MVETSPRLHSEKEQVTVATSILVPTVLIKHGSLPDELQARIRNYDPKTDLGILIKRAAQLLPRVDALELLDAIQRSVVMQSELAIKIYRAVEGVAWAKTPDGQPSFARMVAAGFHRDQLLASIEEHGVVSRKVITNAGIDFLMADWAAGASDINTFKYHGLGTATTAEAATQTALTTEITTAYNPDNTRATGTAVVNAAPNPDTITLTGTNTLDGAATIEEHAIFSQAATGGGTMWDRSLTGTQTLSANDALQAQYTLTANAGG
jgi:hypothetical protein